MKEAVKKSNQDMQQIMTFYREEGVKPRLLAKPIERPIVPRKFPKKGPYAHVTNQNQLQDISLPHQLRSRMDAPTKLPLVSISVEKSLELLSEKAVQNRVVAMSKRRKQILACLEGTHRHKRTLQSLQTEDYTSRFLDSQRRQQTRLMVQQLSDSKE